jgi:uncharacterized membrane protein YecN with MAPEG domain
MGVGFSRGFLRTPSKPRMQVVSNRMQKRVLTKENWKPKRASELFRQAAATAYQPNMLRMLHMIRLDYLSCVLTVLGTVLLGKKLWQGWVVAALNSAVVCVIGVRTAQFGFVPANLLCIALYTTNLINWRPKKQDQ